MLVLKHEFAHALGFADIYDLYGDETSIVNAGLNGLSTHLSPNDFKMIYVAYGNKHINKNGSYSQEKMDEVKQIIKNYESKYYSCLIDKIKDIIKKTNSTNINKNDITSSQKISKDEVDGLTFTNDNAQITIVGDNFTYELNGEIQKGELVLGDDYIILPDIILNNPYDHQTPYNDFLVLFKTNDKIGCYNLNIYNTSSAKNKTEENRGIEITLK